MSAVGVAMKKNTHRASQLERKGLRSIEDALLFVPLRHEDRTRLTPFRSLVPGQAATCSGGIVGVSPPPPGRSRVHFTVMLREASGYATASWFGWRYRARGLKCFFFQAEDGIRGRTVTGVQTCALPI